MENVKKSSGNVAIKWSVIYLLTSVVITFLFQFLNLDQTSPIKYLGYIPFIAFLLLAQKEYRDQLGGYATYGEAFTAGLLYSVFSAILLAVFLYIYLGFINPQLLEQTIAAQHDQLVQRGLSSEQIDSAEQLTRKHGALFGAIGTLFVITIFGVIIALIGAAIFKRERTIDDIERDSSSYTDPAV